jgi:hypothetical protein
VLLLCTCSSCSRQRAHSSACSGLAAIHWCSGRGRDERSAETCPVAAVAALSRAYGASVCRRGVSLLASHVCVAVQLYAGLWILLCTVTVWALCWSASMRVERRLVSVLALAVLLLLVLFSAALRLASLAMALGRMRFSSSAIFDSEAV